MTFIVRGATLTPRIQVYTGASLATLTSITAAFDGDDDSEVRATLGATAGVTYRLRVDDADAIAESFELLWYESSADAGPANDQFVNGQQMVGLLGTVSGTNSGATVETGEPRPSPGATETRRSVWYRWTAPGTGRAVFRTQNTSVDTVVAMYQGSAVASLSFTGAWNDDASPWVKSSRVETGVTAGTEYRIAVSSMGLSMGSFELHWNHTPGSSDTTRPELTVVAPAPLAVLRGMASFRADATDDVAVNRVEVRIAPNGVGTPFFVGEDESPPDQGATYGMDWDSRLVADGLYSVGVAAVDNSWNTFGHGFNVWIDNEPPDTFLSPAINGLSASFALSRTTEVETTLECSLDGAPFGPCVSGITYFNLAEGPHTFEARAVSFGVRDPTPASHSWTAIAPPQLPPSGGGGGGGGGAAPDIQLTKVADRGTAAIGDLISYRIEARIENSTATSGATKVVVTDLLPANVEVVTTRVNRGGGCAGTRTLVCDLDFFSSSTVGMVDVVVRVVGAGEIVNTASAAVTPTDFDPSDNAATARVAARVDTRPTASVPKPAAARGVTRNGGNRADRLRGTPYADVLRGNRGADRLLGLGGNDLLVGGAGVDQLVGGPGNDRLLARDGTRDVITCGLGLDRVEADRRDKISRDCERVTRR